MDLCTNGCGNVWNSPALQEVLDILLGNQSSVISEVNTPDDITLHERIERKVKDKLRKKGNNNATQQETNHKR